MNARTIGFSSLALLALALPVVTLAQGTGNITNVLILFQGWLGMVIGLLIAVAVVVFFWGLIQYLVGEGAEGKASGLKIMLYGILAIFVMVSIWGIIRLLQNTFGVGGDAPVPSPKVEKFR